MRCRCRRANWRRHRDCRRPGTPALKKEQRNAVAVFGGDDVLEQRLGIVGAKLAHEISGVGAPSGGIVSCGDGSAVGIFSGRGLVEMIVSAGEEELHVRVAHECLADGGGQIFKRLVILVADSHIDGLPGFFGVAAIGLPGVGASTARWSCFPPIS